MVKNEGVIYHKKSSSHQTALKGKAAEEKKASHQPTEIESSFLKMDSQQMVKMTYLFNIAYYIAIEE